jgi:hypothetical protein
MKTKIVSCHTANSKPVKQEVNGTVILPPLVFPGWTVRQIGSQVNGQSDRWTVRQMDRQTDGLSGRYTRIRTDGRTVAMPWLFIQYGKI